MECVKKKMAVIDIESMNCKSHISKALSDNEKGLQTSITCDKRYLKATCEIVSLKSLVEELHSVFSSDHVNVEYVSQLMMNYKSNPADWKKYAKFDRFRYTRNLVDCGNGAFNIMVLCWGGGHASSIHDHADSHCFMKILAGELEEVRYSWPEEKYPASKSPIEGCSCEKSTNITKKIKSCTLEDDHKDNNKSASTSGESSGSGTEEEEICYCSRPRIDSPCDSPSEDQTDEGLEICEMVETGKTSLELDDVCYINDTLGLHRVQNPSHVNGAVSLHLYCPPFDACKVFDARTGKATSSQVTFWSMYGSRRNREMQDKRAPEDN